MEFLAFVKEWIDFRSFGSIWYWVVVAGFWAMASQRILGVPMEMVDRALWGDGHAEADAATIARIHAKAIMRGQSLGTIFVYSFAFASCLTLGLWLRMEFFIAVNFFLLPWSYLTLRKYAAARLILATNDAAIVKILSKERLWTRILSLVFTLISAVYGIGHILNHSVLN